MSTVRAAAGGRGSRWRRLLALVVVVVVAGTAFPALAGAHATLKSASPASGAVLDRAPSRVVFSFSERVEGSFGALRVVDEDGRRVDDGRVFRPGSRDDQLAIGVRSGTGRGAFTAAYRVVSADGHPVTGGVTFVVGRDVTAVPTDVRTITAGQEAPAGIGTALAVARTVRYLGIGGVCGLLVLLVVVWLPLRRAGRIPAEADEAFVARGGRSLRTIAVVGGLGAAAALVLQTANAAGTGVGDALDPGVLREVLATRTGAWFGVTVAVFALIAAVAGRAVRARSIRSRSLAVALGLLAVLLVAPALGGHAAASSPAWALVPIEILHVAGMGAWIGGLLGLLVVLPRATRTLTAGPPRTRLLASVLLRFSPVALTSVAVLTAAGTGLALLQLTTLYDLTDTAYGRAVLIKIGLLVVAIGVAVLQRELLVPRLQRLADAGDGDSGAETATDGDEEPDADDEARVNSVPATRAAASTAAALAGRHVRQALRAELVLLVVVLAVTGALAGYPPPKSLASGPATVTRTVGAIQLQLVVDPARTGRNVMHLYAFDARGQPVKRAEELRVRALPPGKAGSSDVPVDVPFVVSGPGHWTAAAVPLGTPGSWKLEIALRTSAFDQAETTVPIRVR